MTAAWRRLAYRVGRLGWQVEVQAEGRDLPMVLDALLPAEASLVIDHFGGASAAAGPTQPGFAALLALVAAGKTYVKLSAPYRS